MRARMKQVFPIVSKSKEVRRKVRAGVWYRTTDQTMDPLLDRVNREAMRGVLSAGRQATGVAKEGT